MPHPTFHPQHPTSFSEFNATPVTGPTYTDLARENQRLKDALAAIAESRDTVTQSLEATKRMLDEARAQVATLTAGQQRNGEARQAAFLELAHELAEMTPEQRDAAIRRIIDNAQ